MTPLTWDLLISLILQHGLPLALKIAEKIGNKDAVTAAELSELRALGAKTPRSQMLDALARAGISHDDPKAAALLALIGP